MNQKYLSDSSTISNFTLTIIVMIIGVFLFFGVYGVNAQQQIKRKEQKEKQKIAKSKNGKTNLKKKHKDEEENDRPAVIYRNGKKYILRPENDLARFDQPAEAEQ